MRHILAVSAFIIDRYIVDRSGKAFGTKTCTWTDDAGKKHTATTTCDEGRSRTCECSIAANPKQILWGEMLMSNGTVSATFRNDSGVSDKFTVWDIGISPKDPKQLFDDYLAPNADTGPLSFYKDNIYGHARYKRAGGTQNDLDVSDGQVVSMT